MELAIVWWTNVYASKAFGQKASERQLITVKDLC